MKFPFLSTTKHYRNIDELPIWNFNKVSDTNDFRYILKLPDYYDLPKKVNEVKLALVYESMINELFVKFGFDDGFISNVRQEKEILILQLKMLSGEKSLKAIINIKEKEISDRKALAQQYKQDFEKKVAIMEAHFKIPFDVHKMSVSRFFTYTSLYSDFVKRNTKSSQVK